MTSRLRSQARVADKVARLVERDGPRCHYCGCEFRATGGYRRTIDHRAPVSAGGGHRTANLALSCANCNKHKAGQSEEKFLSSRWLARRRVQVEREGPAATAGSLPLGRRRL
jgi:5-methylcytosine-specific restriction endonuclease McrA